jgi:hypothetical protein
MTSTSSPQSQDHRASEVFVRNVPLTIRQPDLQ